MARYFRGRPTRQGKCGNCGEGEDVPIRLYLFAGKEWLCEYCLNLALETL